MEPLHLQQRSEVESLYEARPYPPVGYWSPFFQRIRWEERPTLNYRAAYSAAYAKRVVSSHLLDSKGSGLPAAVDLFQKLFNCDFMIQH